MIYGMELGKKYNLNAAVAGHRPLVEVPTSRSIRNRSRVTTAKIVNTGKSILHARPGSTNGTYVNDEPIDEYVLRDGDLIKIGRTIFKFLTGDNIENAYHEEIYRLTTIDGLTQIFNKRYFLETLEREIARAHRYRRALSLVMFDIDHFKKVNDSYGHLAGDYVLKHLASRARRRSGARTCFARYGGEEFAIVLPEIDAAGTRAVRREDPPDRREDRVQVRGHAHPGHHLDGRRDHRGRTPSRSGRADQARRRTPLRGQGQRPQPRLRVASAFRTGYPERPSSSQRGVRLGERPGLSYPGSSTPSRRPARDVGAWGGVMWVSCRAPPAGPGGGGARRPVGLDLHLTQRREQRRRQVGTTYIVFVLVAGLLEHELDRRVAVGDLDRQRRQPQRLAVARDDHRAVRVRVEVHAHRARVQRQRRRRQRMPWLAPRPEQHHRRADQRGDAARKGSPGRCASSG